jgi:hypothetical protein
MRAVPTFLLMMLAVDAVVGSNPGVLLIVLGGLFVYGVMQQESPMDDDDLDLGD